MLKDGEMEFTATQWNNIWEEQTKSVHYDPDERSMKVIRGYISKYMRCSAKMFLEAGCGSARSSLDAFLHHKGLSVTCLDITPNALSLAKKLFRENNADGFFVCGDLRNMPFRDSVFDFVFSDGAIEHFKETSFSIDEMRRLLKDGGRAFVTVPRISLPMLTWGQFEGNIPNIPVVRSLFTFAHKRLFCSRFMKNGCELSFT